MIHPTDAPSLPASLAAIALAVAFCTGCRSGIDADGDMPVTPPAKEFGEGGVHISSKLCDPDVAMTPCASPADCGPQEVCVVSTGASGGVCSSCGFNGPASWIQLANVNSTNCPYPPATKKPYVPVITNGLTVTAVDTYDETGDGAIGTVYVQDTMLPGTPTPQYGATSLFDASYSPPDLRPLPGDVVDVHGVYEEFIGPDTGLFNYCETLPQISGAAAFRFSGAVPEPVVITPNDLNSYANARRYLNMLVKVTNVTIVSTPSTSSGRYSYPVGVGSGQTFVLANELYALQNGAVNLAQGTTYKSVTGVVTFFYNVQLAPRSPADFEM